LHLTTDMKEPSMPTESTPITPDTQVAAIARQHPGTIKVFQRHRIDFCCGGKRPLAAACVELGLAVPEVLGEVQAAAAGPRPERDWSSVPLPELIDHIVGHYHHALRRDLPVLRELAVKVAHRHGADAPGVVAVRETVDRLIDEMTSHMEKEEKVLFPLIERLAADADAGFQMPVGGPVRAMEHEHEEVAEMLRTLRSLTGGYVPPPAACNSFHGLYQMLSELEADTHQHIHLENNVLFPRAEALGAEVHLA
jgi:regulator of cell morphogenesis and NO signaling